MQKKIIVNGMTCQMCAKNIYDKLLAIDGITNVFLNLDLSEIIIDVEHDVSNEDIIFTIESDNKFHVTSIEDGSFKIVPRQNDKKNKLVNRMKRLIGQMNGITKMIEDDRYCDDILIQLSAVDKSIKSLANTILDEHIHTCLLESIKQEKYEVLDEITQLFRRFQ